MLYIATVKLPKNLDHNPRDKQAGPCPVTCARAWCTDTTGEHHSLLVDAPSEADAREALKRHGYGHVTRLESIGLPLA